MLELEKIDKVAILSGAGFLPRQVYDACKQKNIECEVIGLEGQISKELFVGIDYESFPLHAISKILNKMRSLNINKVIFAGRVKRTSVTKLLLDKKGPRLLAMIVKAGINDNAILSTIIEFLEKEGFAVLAPNKIADKLVIEEGFLTISKPNKEASADIKKGLDILKAIANFDVGQSLVIQNGLVLGIEAAEGTDELIKRCGQIQQKEDEPCILIKVCKPNQDKRIDLPCIGTTTILNLKKSNFKGVAVEAGSTLMLDRKNAIEEANKLGIFIYGIPTSTHSFIKKNDSK